MKLSSVQLTGRQPAAPSATKPGLQDSQPQPLVLGVAQPTDEIEHCMEVGKVRGSQP